MKTGTLFLIPNYIGDTHASRQFPLYNKEIIQSLKYFFVENPKPARALIKSLYTEVNFDEVELFHFDKHSNDNQEVYTSVLNVLKNGFNVGVVSDAGCPGIADPGSELVRWAHEKNIEVIPLVGPSSIFLTLMASGLNGQNFTFLGYLPKGGAERKEQIKKMIVQIRNSGTTFLMIETPYKTDATFKELLELLNPDNHLCLGIDIFSNPQRVITRTVQAWRDMKALPSLKDRQVVFAVG